METRQETPAPLGATHAAPTGLVEKRESLGSHKHFVPNGTFRTNSKDQMAVSLTEIKTNSGEQRDAIFELAHPVYSKLRQPLIRGHKKHADVTRDICQLLDPKPGVGWWISLSVAIVLLVIGVIATYHTVMTGIGTWGLNRTVGWAFDITNFVFWIGIGHAGTFISAILFLFNQKWRTSVNRSAEAMTLIAVMCAGLFPIIHMGQIGRAHV